MSEDMMGQPRESFESIRQQGDDRREFWFARDLAPLLEYQDWRNFQRVMEKAKQACAQSGHAVADHFGDVTKMVEIGSSARRPVEDVRLSRYACYLIVQNGDPAKPVIAHGQTYFALQTRRQELTDGASFNQLDENERRLVLRSELARHNKDLAAAAQQAGVALGMSRHRFWSNLHRSMNGPDRASSFGAVVANLATTAADQLLQVLQRLAPRTWPGSGLPCSRRNADSQAAQTGRPHAA